MIVIKRSFSISSYRMNVPVDVMKLTLIESEPFYQDINLFKTT